MTSPGRVVVVGGGIAGVSTAAALRAQGYGGDVTVVDVGELPYDRPPLSKEYLRGVKDLKQIALQSPEWFDEQRIRLVSGTRVTALETGAGSVHLDHGPSLPADRVVLAAGGAAARLRVPGADGPKVHVLRTADDADALRTALQPGADVLVVGAALIGSEVASTALELGCRVTVADPVCPPLADVVGADLAEWLHAQHGRRGATVLRSCLARLTDTRSGVEAEYADGTVSGLHAAVVVGVGMTPDTRLAAAAGIEVGRGVLVDDLQRTSTPQVLAVGDAARRRPGSTVTGAEHWEAARLDGERAAAALLGLAPPEPSAPWFWSDRHGHHVEAVGRMADAERLVLRGAVDAPPCTVFGLFGGRVVAAAAVDDTRTMSAARRLVDARTEVSAEVLQDTGTDLRRLLRRTA